MKILLNNNDLNEALSRTTNLGFVPTMGSLHKGHISLIKRSLRECKKTIVSIFVNPTQFNNINDFKKYPRNSKKDLSILKKLNVNFVYLPKQKDIYSPYVKGKIKLKKKEKILCAAHRKGHFEGVIDVMNRFTKLIKPSKIFMGEKDFQQLFLLKKKIQKKFGTKIILCKTVREHNKLAFSSRNSLLTKKNFIKAGKIAKSLISFKKNLRKNYNLKKLLTLKKKELINLYNIKIDYLELRNVRNLNIANKTVNSKIFIAYYLDKVRLIDNF